jgi:hypothetical protein
LDAQPRYKLEVVSRVLNELGCTGGKQGAAWRWKSASGSRHGHVAYFSYVPDRGCSWILQDDLVTGALRLEKDPDEVVTRVKRGGGEFLDP